MWRVAVPHSWIFRKNPCLKIQHVWIFRLKIFFQMGSVPYLWFKYMVLRTRGKVSHSWKEQNEEYVSIASQVVANRWNIVMAKKMELIQYSSMFDGIPLELEWFITHSSINAALTQGNTSIHILLHFCGAVSLCLDKNVTTSTVDGYGKIYRTFFRRGKKGGDWGECFFIISKESKYCHRKYTSTNDGLQRKVYWIEMKDDCCPFTIEFNVCTIIYIPMQWSPHLQ